MRQFTIVAATVAIAALISGAPASADHIQGGPIKQNGQCWRSSKKGQRLAAGIIGNRASKRLTAPSDRFAALGVHSSFSWLTCWAPQVSVGPSS